MAKNQKWVTEVWKTLQEEGENTNMAIWIVFKSTYEKLAIFFPNCLF